MVFENTVKTILSAADTGSGPIARVGAALKALQDRTKLLTATWRDITVIGSGVVAIYTRLANAGAAAVRGAQGLELSQVRLNFALATTKQNTQQYRDSLYGLALQLQATTRFSAQTTLEMANILVSMGRLSGEQVPRAIRALQDYVEAYKGGNGIVEITRQFARGIGATGGDLGEMGIKLHQNMTAAEKWASAIFQLERKYQGFAEVVGRTATGGLDIFINKMQLVAENFGLLILRSTEFQAILHLVTQVLQRWGFVTLDVSKNHEELQRSVNEVLSFLRTVAVVAIGAVIKGFEYLIRAASWVADAFIKLKINLGTFLFDLGTAIADLNVLGTSFKETGTHMRNWGLEMVQGAEATKTWLGYQQAMATRNKETGKWTSETTSILDRYANGVAQTAANVFGLNKTLDDYANKMKFTTDVTRAGHDVTQEMTAAFKDMKTEVEGTQRALEQYFVEAFDPEKGRNVARNNLFKALREEFTRGSSSLIITPLFKFKVEEHDVETNQTRIREQLGALGEIQNTIMSPFAGIGEGFADARLQAGLFGEAAVNGAQSIREAFRPLGRVIGAIFNVPMALIGKFLDMTIGALGRLLETALVEMGILQAAHKGEVAANTAAALASQVAIASGASAAAGVIGAAWAPAAALSLVATLGGSASAAGMLPGIIAGATAASTSIISASSIARGAILGAAGGGVAGHATGGITMGPHLAMVGDNPSGKEAIIPLDSPNARDMLGGFGGTTNITINIAKVSRDDDPRAFADEVVKHMRRQLKLVTGTGRGGR